MFRPEAIFVALLLSLSFVVAETSLYIPGFNEQPISVTAIGVSPEGRTTWQMVPGKPTGTVPPIPITVTATMIQGPSDAVVHASFPQIEVVLSCALNSGIADCVGELKQPGKTVTTSLRETMKPYLVQGGASGGDSPGPTPPPSSGGASDSGSAVTTAVMCVGMLVGSVFAGTATLFLV